MQQKDKYNYDFILPEYRSQENNDKEKTTIHLNNLRFIVPEVLFNPNIIGIEIGRIKDGIIQSINECHEDYKNLLFKNIITNGGNTKINGFNQRLIKELIHENNDGITIYGQDREEEPVIDGMKLFCQNSELINDLAITKKEYEDIGFNITWKNCL